MSLKANKRVKSGDVVRIPLGEGYFGFGVVLERPLMAFFRVKSKEDPPIESLIEAPVLFKVWVMESAIKSGRWQVIGSVKIQGALLESPAFFKIDPISGVFSIYRAGVDRPANVDECKGLERASVWSAEHVEQRIDDEISGRANKWARLF